MPSIDRRSLQHFDWGLFGLVALLVAIGFANLYSATRAGAESGLPPEFRRQLFALGLGAAGDAGRPGRRLPAPRALGGADLPGEPGAARLDADRSRPSRAATARGSSTARSRSSPRSSRSSGWSSRWRAGSTATPPSRVPRLRDLLRAGADRRRSRSASSCCSTTWASRVLTLLIACTYLPFTGIPWRAWRARRGRRRDRASPALWTLRAQATTSRSASSTSSIPSRDPLASGYQAIQSQIAIGSGGLFGKGYLEGTQTQLRFLPTQHTDFAFSVLAEEWGFVGSVLVLALYLGAADLGARDRAQLEGRLRRDARGRRRRAAVLAAVINVAMVLGLAPVIGVPLPAASPTAARRCSPR